MSFRDLPPLSSLRTFEAAARHRSFKNAASELNVTPSAVSRQIRTLEADVGTPLFQRGHRAVELTAEGEELFQTLTRGFGDIQHCIAALRGRHLERYITVGSTSAFAHYWLMPRMGQFWIDNELVVNHVMSDREADLRQSAIDLCIRYGDGDWPGEESAKLFGDTLYPVCAPTLLQGSKQPLSLEELLKYRLIELSGVDPRWSGWAHFLSSQGISEKPRMIRRVNSYIIGLEAAINGLGVALGWDRLVAPLIADGRLIRPTDAEMETPRAYYVTWRADRPLSLDAEKFRDWLVDAHITAEP